MLLVQGKEMCYLKAILIQGDICFFVSQLSNDLSSVFKSKILPFSLSIIFLKVLLCQWDVLP